MLSTAGAQPRSGPQWSRGDEFTFTGEIQETSERIENRFRKNHDLEVVALVLEQDRDGSLLAVCTRVRPRLDPTVTGVGLPPPEESPASLHFEMIRVDLRGRAWRLVRPGMPPYDWSPRPEDAAVPGAPWDQLPTTELGWLFPWPAQPLELGTEWAHAEPQRPPLVFRAKSEAIERGARCWLLEAQQETDGWDRPTEVNLGTQRLDRLWVHPTEGIASRVERTIRHRLRKQSLGQMTIRYEALSPSRHTPSRLAELRRACEWAYYGQSEYESLLDQSAPATRFQATLNRLEREWNPGACPWLREFEESLKRRYLRVAQGHRPARLPSRAANSNRVATLGQPAPDFVVPRLDRLEQFRLGLHRGIPVVLGFYRPGRPTTAPTLEILAALDRYYSGRVAVVGLAVHEPSERALTEARTLAPNLPLAEGQRLLELYQVHGYPKWFLLNAEGTLIEVWSGVGAETGYLIRQTVEQELKASRSPATAPAVGTPPAAGTSSAGGGSP